MDKRIESALQDIGLTSSEIKVYISLLKIGASSTGPILAESQTANSKIYEVLDKLMQKGMVSYFMKEGVRYYKAANPKMILDYLEEKKKRIKTQESQINSIIPTLMMMSDEKQSEREASIFTGPRGIKTVFTNIVEECSPEDEIHIMGIHDFSEQFLRLVKNFHTLRSNKKLGTKILINKSAKKIVKEFIQFPFAQVKLMPEKIFTPAIFLIYKDKVVINIPDDMTSFVLRSNSANKAFDAYFDIMWQDKGNERIV